jgi:hypothetical protein
MAAKAWCCWLYYYRSRLSVRLISNNIELFGATLLQHKNKWWIFGAVAQNGGSAQDDLAIFYSERLEGPWQPHRLNPVVSQSPTNCFCNGARTLMTDRSTGAIFSRNSLPARSGCEVAMGPNDSQSCRGDTG